MENMEARNVFYGSWGMLWIDGQKIAEIKEIKATLNAEKTEINMARKMQKGYKVTGYEGKGTFKVHKVSSYFIKKLAPSIKQGRQVLFTMVSEVADPDAIGNERVALYKCMVDSVDLINWALKAVSEEEYAFTFEDYDLLNAA